ncbi:hypothetical protein J4210_01245 [Candidatus Woesearchaeota archaeon]|nr:hypothetical protein [Candidatus Woesearchaeota archaeon]
MSGTLPFFKERCDYCHHDLPQSRSHWEGKDGSHHYKNIDCSNCRRTNWIHVHFQGSGHDSFREKMTIESMVSKVRER